MSVNSNGYIHLGGNIRNIYILLLLSLSFGTVTDIDGNIYETVQIGEQLWMAQNLKVTHYNNGDEMPNLTINNDWTSASIGAYSDYDNNPTNSETYGRLYNWYTVNDERGICPEGYHVPTDDEYSELEVYLGMSESETNIIGFRGTNEGSKLAGNSELWNIGVLVIDPEFGTSGFNALPAGFRVYSSGDFDTVGEHCYYWSSSENSNSHAWYRNLLYFNTRVYRNSPSKQSGFSIRCLGDEITTGCTHPNATNYDETANVDDGSCEYECDEGFIEIDGECYYQSDLDVLQQFIDNSQEGDVSPSWLPVPSDLMPLELGLQTWENGRLVEFCCSTWYVGCHSDYELTGDIPSEVGNLTHLTWLGLHNNNLSGEIPPEIGNLVNLEMLHLSSNQLSGEIPSEIGNLENLYHLWLYSNALSGEIPESICNINLDWEASWIDGLPSYIYNNQLCPTYPDCLEENIGYQDTSECYGCTHPNATNYDETANVDDGSCEFEDDNIVLVKDVAVGNTSQNIQLYNIADNNWYDNFSQSGQGGGANGSKYAYDPINNRLFFISNDASGTGYEINIYSFESDTWSLGQYLLPEYSSQYHGVFDIVYDTKSDVLVLANWSGDGILGEYIFTYNPIIDEWNQITTCDSGGEGNGIKVAYNHLTGKVLLFKYYQYLFNIYEIDVISESCIQSVSTQLENLYGNGNTYNLNVSNDNIIYDSKRDRIIWALRESGDNNIKLIAYDEQGFSLLSNFNFSNLNIWLDFGIHIPLVFLPKEDKLGLALPEFEGGSGNGTLYPIFYEFESDNWTQGMELQVNMYDRRWDLVHTSGNGGCLNLMAINYDANAFFDNQDCEFYSGPDWYVSTVGTDAEGYGSVDSPFSSIQHAIDAASDGDTILVSAGTYLENFIWPATNGIKLIGSGEDDCIIDGGSLASVIRFEEDLGGIIDTTTLITGFTIQNGYAQGVHPNTSGGGMYLYSSSPTLTDVTFSNNTALSGGGMKLYQDSSPTLTDVTFSDNTAESGGGMYLHNSSSTLTNVTFSANAAYNQFNPGTSGGGMNLYHSSPTLTNVTFSYNTSGSYGGGMYIVFSNPTLTDVTFSGNTTRYGGGMNLFFSNPTLTDVTFIGNTSGADGAGNYSGGGMVLTSSSPTLTDVTFSNNTALSGGGMYLEYSSPTLTDVTFSNNTAGLNGGGMYISNSNPTLTNSILWGNSPNEIFLIGSAAIISYSDIQGGFEGTGNIDTDPLFTDLENGDFSLQPSSPCIDAGDPEILDLDGSRSDMGAYYFPQESNTLSIDEGANLMSFSVLPRNGLDDLPNDISGIIGAGVAATNLPPWSGSLQELRCEDGYWLINSGSAFEWDYFGIPCSDSLIYNLIEGANLISYSKDESGSLSDVLPDAVEDCLSGIIGQGVASNNMPPWAGSLTTLDPNKGYWFKSNCEIDFQYEEPTTLTRLDSPKTSQYAYNQSSQQAFYFIESIENIEQGDIIHTYSNGINVGSRVWNGSFTDVPAMGDDGSKFTAGYCIDGSIPTFKVEKANGSLITLTGDIPEWSNNQLYMIGYLEESIALPAVYSLSTAYPNPFNPTTTLSFAIPVDSEVSLSIYNLQGRQVSTLIDGNMDAGYHSVVWDANSYASGVYFVKMMAGEYISTQKLTLIK